MESQYSYGWTLVKDFDSYGILILGVIGYILKLDIEKKRQCRVVATALLAEINSISERYFHATSGGITFNMTQINGESCTIMELEVTQNYFCVFENNTDRIGFMDTKDVADVVDFYVTAKGLIDTYSALGAKNTKYIEAQFNYYIQGKVDNVNVNMILNNWFLELPKHMAVLYDLQKITFEKADKVKKRLKKYINKPPGVFGNTLNYFNLLS